MIFRLLGPPIESTDIAFVDTRTGATLAAFTHVERHIAPSILFPCGLNVHAGLVMEGGSPATERAVAVLNTVEELKAYIVNLESGQVIYSDVKATPQGGVLNCAQDTLWFGGDLIDLKTAAVVATPGSSNPALPLEFTC